MRVINYDGKEYRSMKVLCDALHISNQKLRRLCRHYVRASKDPAVAVRWITGAEPLSPNEPKTFKYEQDLERGRERQDEFKARFAERFRMSMS